MQPTEASRVTRSESRGRDGCGSRRKQGLTQLNCDLMVTNRKRLDPVGLEGVAACAGRRRRADLSPDLVHWCVAVAAMRYSPGN